MKNNNLTDLSNTLSRTAALALPSGISSIPRSLLVLAVALALAAATGSALADDRHRGNGPRFKPSHPSSFNRDYRPQVRHANRHARASWNRNFNRNYTRNTWYSNNRFYDNRYRDWPRDRDNWSVSLNFGSGYSNWQSTSLFYGTGLYGSSFYPRRTHTSVIYNQPTVVYVNESRPVTTTRVITRSSDARTSLLRDIHGDCFERSYDSRGREIRTRLPDSACNF